MRLQRKSCITPGSSPRVTFVVGLLTAGVRAAPGRADRPARTGIRTGRAATISLAIGINLLLYGLVGPFAAALMDRLGVRRTMALSMTLTAAAVAMSPAMHRRMAADRAVGRGRRRQHRRDRQLYRRLYRGALVPQPPGIGGRGADRGQCRRPAGVPAEPGQRSPPISAGGRCRWCWPSWWWPSCPWWPC